MCAHRESNAGLFGTAKATTNPRPTHRTNIFFSQIAIAADYVPPRYDQFAYRLTGGYRDEGWFFSARLMTGQPPINSSRKIPVSTNTATQAISPPRPPCPTSLGDPPRQKKRLLRSERDEAPFADLLHPFPVFSSARSLMIQRTAPDAIFDPTRNGRLNRIGREPPPHLDLGPGGAIPALMGRGAGRARARLPECAETIVGSTRASLREHERASGAGWPETVHHTGRARPQFSCEVRHKEGGVYA
ncbi:hypothetical protein BU17DRAFT_65743 [Hysterangium stoloniferum]|nr:hypothetical protein BU17DRAFT_65743 [Hysterangium stoloniferum]